MPLNNVAAWAWSQAAVSKRLVEIGTDESYLAEKYAGHLGAMSDAQLASGADVIRAIIDDLAPEDQATYTTAVEQRDVLAALFEVGDMSEGSA